MATDTPKRLVCACWLDNAKGRHSDARRYATESLIMEQEAGCQQGTAESLHLLGEIAGKLQRAKEGFNLMSLAAFIFTEIGQAKVVKLQKSLEELVSTENYSNEQLLQMNRQVLNSYRKDGGKDLIGDVIKRWGNPDC